MVSKQDLIKKYSEYSDSELLKVSSNIEDFTDEAKGALQIVIEKRGGIESFNERIRIQTETEDEIERLKSEISNLCYAGMEPSEITGKIESEYLSQNELAELVKAETENFKKSEADKNITLRTIIGSVVGMLIGTVLGGLLCGYILVYTSHFYFLTVVGYYLISYVFIRLITKQSKKNIVVLVSSGIGTILAIILGFKLFYMIGYLG